MVDSFRCANCGDRELGFDFAVSAYRSSGDARELMHRFKYGKQVHLGRLMGSLAGEVWHDRRLQEESWWVVPVPLHPRRQRSRGFNQSREIGVEMIKSAPPGIRLSLKPVIRRARHTVRQAQLDRKERLRNPRGAFELVREGRLKRMVGNSAPKRILIVDDVMTTGSTVSECASVIRSAFEVELIAGVTVMRG
jgi:ComF family protein